MKFQLTLVVDGFEKLLMFRETHLWKLYHWWLKPTLFLFRSLFDVTVCYFKFLLGDSRHYETERKTWLYHSFFSKTKSPLWFLSFRGAFHSLQPIKLQLRSIYVYFRPTISCERESRGISESIPGRGRWNELYPGIQTCASGLGLCLEVRVRYSIQCHQSNYLRKPDVYIRHSSQLALLWKAKSASTALKSQVRFIIFRRICNMQEKLFIQ